MATAVLVTLLFLMPLFYYTPNVVLAAIIITAVVGLIDYQAMHRLWKVDKLDFLACSCSFLGVLFISVSIGLSIAVYSLLLLLVIYQIFLLSPSGIEMKLLSFIRLEYQCLRFFFI